MDGVTSKAAAACADGCKADPARGRNTSFQLGPADLTRLTGQVGRCRSMPTEIQLGSNSMNHRMPGLSLGFTLLELTVTVAVIGLLAAIAVPAYQEFSIRSKVSEALNMGSAAKSAVIDAASSNGLGAVTAAAMADTLSSNPSPFVAEIAIEDGGRILMKTRNTGAEPSPELWLVPSQAGGAITWECRVADAAHVRYVPPICRDLDSSSTAPSSFAPEWLSASQCNGTTTSEKVKVEVTSKSESGFKTKPVATSNRDSCYVDEATLKNEGLTRGQPALVDMSPTSSGQFDLEKVAISNSQFGGWGVALASSQDPFSGYTIQFEPINSNACGGKGTGPCTVLVEWQKGKEISKSPGEPLPPDFSFSNPGDISVKVNGSGVNVSAGGNDLFKSDSLDGDQWVFGVRSWSGATLDVAGSQITTP